MIIGSLFCLENLKSQNRLKEIEAQQAKELAIILERERIEEEQKEEEADDKAWETTLRNDCIQNAEEAYWTYMKLNGTEKNDGTIWAGQNVWNNAADDKKSAVDLCFKKYPVN